MAKEAEEEIEALARDLYDMKPGRSPQYPTQRYSFDSNFSSKETEDARYLAKFLYARGWRKLEE